MEAADRTQITLRGDNQRTVTTSCEPSMATTHKPVFIPQPCTERVLSSNPCSPGSGRNPFHLLGKEVAATTGPEFQLSETSRPRCTTSKVCATRPGD